MKALKVPPSRVVLAALIVLPLLLRPLFGGEGPLAKEEGMPCAALLAYAIVRVLRRRDARAEEDATAAACAVVGAAYCVSALSKLSASGLAWADGSTLRVMAGAKALESAGALAHLRDGLAESPVLAAALAVAALLVEGSGFLMLAPRLRRGYVLAAAGLHAGIWLLLGIGFWHWALTALVFGLAPGVDGRRRAG